MTTSQSVLFIINKSSGKGFRHKTEGKIINESVAHSIECTIEYTKEKGHATILATDGIKNGFKKIIAVGGDGTVNEVARALINTSIPMGIIPTGSGNGLARHLSIPMQFDRALQVVFMGGVIPIDTFTINGKPSINVSGVGFDGEVANQFGKDGKRGLAGYTKQVVKNLFGFQEFFAKIKIDNTDHDVSAFVIAIANASQYGNNARIAPHALISDQKLDIVVVKKPRLYQTGDFLTKLFSGTVCNSSLCSMYQSETLQIDTTAPQPYHIDGEACGCDHSFLIKIVPQSLHVIAPLKTNSVPIKSNVV